MSTCVVDISMIPDIQEQHLITKEQHKSVQREHYVDRTHHLVGLTYPAFTWHTKFL
ncbi:hypothetical protein YC2023_091505 [Brassica napus]